MNILMFGWEFPPFISGGLGTACAGLTKGLNDIGGVQTTFVLPKPVPNFQTDYSGPATSVQEPIKSVGFIDSIRFVEIESFIPAYSPISPTTDASSPNVSNPPSVSRSSYFGESITNEAIRYANSAKNLVKEFADFDIIHAHDWLTYLAGTNAKKLTGKPLVVHVHSTEFDRSGENYSKEIFRIERFGMDNADKIIAVSNYTRDIIIQRYAQDPKKVVTIYNATDAMPGEKVKKGSSEQPFVVVFLGRITYQKGPEYFVEAARITLQKTKNIRFIMAGDGDLLPRMKSLVAALGIGEYFQFTGFLDSAGVQDLFSRADAYVMPSVSEPFGIAGLEAIDACVPVIVSQNSGLAELVEHVIKVDPTNCEAISESIIRLIKAPELAKQLTVSAKKEINKINWQTSAEGLKELYLQLAND